MLDMMNEKNWDYDQNDRYLDLNIGYVAEKLEISTKMW